MQPLAHQSAQVKTVRDDRELNARQATFVREYLCDLNGTQAAIRAGYSPNSAAEQAFDLLREPNIAAAISGEREKRSQVLELRASDVLTQAYRMAMSDVRNYFKPSGEPIPPHELSEEAAAAVQHVDVVPAKFDVDGKPTAFAYRYRLVDKSSALEKLFRHLGL